MCVDGARGAFPDPPDLDDAPVAHGHVRGAPRGAGAVDQRRVREQQIDRHRARLLRSSLRRLCEIGRHLSPDHAGLGRRPRRCPQDGPRTLADAAARRHPSRRAWTGRGGLWKDRPLQESGERPDAGLAEPRCASTLRRGCDGSRGATDRRATRIGACAHRPGATCSRIELDERRALARCGAALARCPHALRARPERPGERPHRGWVGPAWALGGFALFSLHDAAVKSLAGYSPFQIVFFAVLFSYVPFSFSSPRTLRRGTFARSIRGGWRCARCASRRCWCSRSPRSACSSSPRRTRSCSPRRW